MAQAKSAIVDLRTQLMVVPYAELPVFLPGFNRPREILVLELETADGVVGMGFVQPITGGARTIETCLHELLKPMLLGRDSTDIEGIWRSVYQGTHMVGRMGIVLFALSGVDIALWDALGKRASLPLYRLWGGGGQPQVPAYGSGCYRGMGGDGMIEKARRYVAQGFKAIKMQVAHMHTLREDLDNVRRMREALGDEIDIMIDVNQGWCADDAIRMGLKFQELDIFWLEEPVPVDDFNGSRRVSQALHMPVVGGENLYTRWDYLPYIEQSVFSILQPDVMRGGFTEMRKIAAMADVKGLRVAPHLFPELMVHVLASIPNGLILEYMGWLDDMWVQPVLPVQGFVTVPERPGHGLAFKPDVLKEFAV